MLSDFLYYSLISLLVVSYSIIRFQIYQHLLSFGHKKVSHDKLFIILMDTVRL